MEKGLITVHTVVRNEDRFVWFALNSVLPYVDRILVVDTGSDDKTVEVIRSIRSPKIIFEEKGILSSKELTRLRQEQIKRTQTPFFLLLDGDEVWPRQSIERLISETKNLPEEKIAVVCRTRDAVGDVYHYLPERAGQYHLAGQTGHLSMRLLRNLPDLSVDGIYPLESYLFKGKPLNNWDEKLQFLDVWYLHLTHLTRSSSREIVSGFRRHVIEKGAGLPVSELPEVFSQPRQGNIPDPLEKRGAIFEISASLVTPIKDIKRKFFDAR